VKGAGDEGDRKQGRHKKERWARRRVKKKESKN
jgi:hypothetical protein